MRLFRRCGLARRLLPIVILAGTMLPAAACRDSTGQPTITVAAASDLRVAFDQLAPAYERACDCHVRLTYGSSGTFATQIKEGLPADVFASANVAYVDDLDSAGLIVPGSQRLYAIGKIVIAFPAAAAQPPSGLGDLTAPDVRKVSIANPEHAPYGAAAKEALVASDLWARVEPRLVLGENASQATQFVETGDAQAGIIPLSLAVQNTSGLKYTLVDDSLYTPLRQAAAVLKRSAHPELAEGFLAFINSPEGRTVMNAYGFVLPSAEPP